MKERLNDWTKAAFAKDTMAFKVVAAMVLCFTASAALAWAGAELFVFPAVYSGIVLSMVAIGMAVSFIAIVPGFRVRIGHVVLIANTLLLMFLAYRCWYDTFVYTGWFKGLETALYMMGVFPAQAAVYLYFLIRWAIRRKMQKERL